MTTATNEQSTENMEHTRGLLKRKQPGFSATLELAADMVRQELQEKPPGHPRQAVGLPKEKGSWHTGTPNVTSLSYASSKPKPGNCSRAWTSRIQSRQPRVAAACLGRC